MHSVLSARRLGFLFGGLFLFQVTALVATLSLTSNLFLSPLGVQRSSFSSAESDELDPSAFVEPTGAEAVLPASEIAVSPLAADQIAPSLVRVAAGETLATIFRRIGAPHASALLADKTLRSLDGSVGSLRIGETIEIVQQDSGEVLSMKRTLPDGRIVTLSGSSSAGYQATVLDVKVLEEPKTVSGIINSSLSAAASDLGLPFSVVDDFVDLFSNRVEFRRDLQPGDTFSVTYLERRNERTGEPLRTGAITSASLKTGGKLLVAVQHADENGELRYFDEQGNPLGNYFLRYPLQFSRISSAFSYARFHPILKRSRPHNGVDFAAPTGTPVRAVADGIVEIASYQGGGGNTVRIAHGSRWATAYLHLNKISSDVRQGMRVSRGQVIGTVGTTGLSTGPHLHFSLYDRGQYVDPLKTALPAMNEKVKPLPREYLLAALEALDLEHQRVASLNSSATAG